MVAPKAAVKVDLPVRFLFGRVAVHFGIIKVLGEFELAEIELRLQLAQVLPRPLHRREAEGCGNLREHRLLLVRRRILGKEGVELRLVPLPRLLERRTVAGREQQAQKIAEIARDDVHAVLAAVHRAHGEDHLAKTAHKAEVAAVHARPAEDGSALGRAEIGEVFLAARNAEGRQVELLAQKSLIKRRHGRPSFGVQVFHSIPHGCEKVTGIAKAVDFSRRKAARGLATFSRT